MEISIVIDIIKRIQNASNLLQNDIIVSKTKCVGKVQNSVLRINYLQKIMF